MKTKIITGCLLLMLGTGNSFSQSASNLKDNNENAVAIVSSANIKNNFTESGDVSVLITEKVKKNFDKYFAGVNGAAWTQEGKNFKASFVKDGLLHYALLSKRGELLYSLCIGTEKNVPANLRSRLKDEYPKYHLTVSGEVKFPDREVWIMYLENDKNILTIGAQEDYMELMKTTRK